MTAPHPGPVPAGLDSCRAAMPYDVTARHVLTGLKNGDQRTHVTALARLLVPLVEPVPGLVVTWAPTGADRRRRRGFDQAELLARAVARRGGWRAAALLRRLPGPPQAGRAGVERRRNPAFASTRPWTGPVVVVDDVVTTGATLAAAAAALRRGGAREVHALVVARAGGGRTWD